MGGKIKDLDEVTQVTEKQLFSGEELRKRQLPLATIEEIEQIRPNGRGRQRSIGIQGDDTPSAVLSKSTARLAIISAKTSLGDEPTD